MRLQSKIIACLLSFFWGCTVQAADMPPQFSDYAIAPTQIKNPAKPKIMTAQDREFSSKIRLAARQPANFAGHFVLSSFGCGASCLMTFVIDKKSGEVSWLPFTVCCWDSTEPDFVPIDFRKDSRLLIISGSRNESGKGIYYYQFIQKEFILINQRKM